MAKKIALVGCGNIGSYHLQSLAKLKESCCIQVVEPNPLSVEIGKQRLNSILHENAKKIDVQWLTNIDRVDENADLTIIATLATGRIDVISKLISMGHRRFLIEKVVCQSSDDYERLLCLMNDHNAKGWVNCTLRYTDFYRKAASVLQAGRGPMVFNARLGTTGLGCNAIHFIDLFNWFTGDCESLKLDGRYIMPRLFANSRGEDLVEFAGTITGQNQNGDFLTITFFPDNDDDFTVNIFCENVRVWISETLEKGFISVKDSDWDLREYQYQPPYTSIITAKIVEEIFSNDSCHLPELEELFASHKELFGVFNSVIETVANKQMELCPIT